MADGSLLQTLFCFYYRSDALAKNSFPPKAETIRYRTLHAYIPSGVVYGV